jgi:hypothetical protein
MVFSVKIRTIFINIFKHSLKSRGTKDHFKWVKQPGIAAYQNGFFLPDQVYTI